MNVPCPRTPAPTLLSPSLLALAGDAVGGNASNSGGGSRQAGWGDAALLVGAVAGCMYAVLRKSGQYALRKSESRLL